MDTATSLVYRLVRIVAGDHDSVASRWFGWAILLASVALSASLTSGPSPELKVDPQRW
jgi:hypothetical protein